mmetsp:Transcript_9199/g.14542  ORF Transcript_9199/g.14542 Transcript_9199/m.14542 type:complete len:394 (+) Transcript_9199:87-1268(+)
MDNDKDLEIWKIKSLIKKLENIKGSGTSMISLVIPPGDQISRIQKMLIEEYGTASNIKSRVNRLSVLSAIVSTQQKLKLYSKIPENGLIIYCGTVLDDNNKEKKVSFDICPHKKVKTSLYLCDSKFHIDVLYSLLDEDQILGFIIIDGKSTILGRLRGNSREISHKLSVDLPKKHGRGGQSAVRFSRIRMEKRAIYMKKVSELAVQSFLHDNNTDVSGIILAGSAEFKNELLASNYFDIRVTRKIISVIDVANGGERGLDQALTACQDTLKDIRFIREKKIINYLFEEIAKNSGKYVFGFSETIEALKSGAIENIILWENLEVKIETISCLNLENNESTNFDYEIDDLLAEWIISNATNFGAKVCIISDKTPEGVQFIRGFGGLGGLLRYSLN